MPDEFAGLEQRVSQSLEELSTATRRASDAMVRFNVINMGNAIYIGPYADYYGKWRKEKRPCPMTQGDKT